MRAGLLLLAGVWVLTQVLAGNALGRLGITGAPTTPGEGSSSSPAPVRAVAPLPPASPAGMGA